MTIEQVQEIEDEEYGNKQKYIELMYIEVEYTKYKTQRMVR